MKMNSQSALVMIGKRNFARVPLYIIIVERIITLPILLIVELPKNNHFCVDQHAYIKSAKNSIYKLGGFVKDVVIALKTRAILYG